MKPTAPLRNLVQRACHDTLPWLISFSLGPMKRVVISLAFSAALLAMLPPLASAAKGDFIEPRKLRDTVRISVGQEFAVAFDQRGERLVNPRRVQGAQKRPVVTLKFYVPPDHKNLLVLVVGSSYPRIVRYRAAARAKGYRDFIETNMLPLNPNVPVYEGWSDPFVELILFDFRLTNEKLPKMA
jgi:hypothetical protein